MDLIDRQAAIKNAHFPVIDDASYEVVRVDDILAMPPVTPKQPGWIPCSERLPDSEKTVLVTVEVRPKGFMHYKKVVKAFYESGKVTEDDSAYTWYNCDNLVENENGEYVVPEGWWEDVDYTEEFTAIDDFVTAWMPLPEPAKIGDEQDE